MPQLAPRMFKARPSSIMQVVEKTNKLKAEGKSIISFSIGVPNFLPAQHVYDAAHKAIDNDPGIYQPNRGTPALVKAFLTWLENEGLGGYTDKNVCAGIGAKDLLWKAMYAVLQPGDEVIIPTPYWTTYLDITDILEAKAVLLPCGPEQNYKLKPEQIAAAVTPKTKMILLNNPSNPTGMVYTPAEIDALAAELVKHDIWVLADDIYSRLMFDGLEYKHVTQSEPKLRDRTILLQSASKIYGMPGWRIGMLAAPEALATAIVNLNSNGITNLPHVCMEAAVAAYTGPQDFTFARRDEFAQKRDQVLAAMTTCKGVNCPKPQGAFYVFPDISCTFGKSHNGVTIHNDVDFCNLLLEHAGVAVVPGSAFGEPKAIRISYACKPADLAEGLKRWTDFFAALQ